MSILYALLLLIVLAVCWVLTILSMPGNWLMVAAAAVYAWLVPEDSIAAMGWWTVGGLALLAAAGEAIETLAAALGVSKAGGSRRGAALALVGSLVGAVCGAIFGLPIPVVGQLIAAILFAALGAMGGAYLGEQWKGRTSEESWQVGKAAFLGRLAGTLAKVIVASVMVAAAALALVF